MRISAVLVLVIFGGLLAFNQFYRWQSELLSEATSLLYNEEYAAALEKFESVLILPVGSGHRRDALEGKGLCLSGLGRLPEAIAVQTELIEMTGDSLELMGHLSRRASLHERNNDLRAAVEDVSESIRILNEQSSERQARLSPITWEYYSLRGRAYQALGDEDRARQDFETAAELEPPE